MLTSKTPVSQGTKGLGVAISEFVMREWIVCVPLNDNQEYDLVVDQGEGPRTVQIKTTRGKEDNLYVVQLKSVRHNRTKNNIRRFDNSKVDFLFVLCDDGSRYLIPAREISATCSVRLTNKWSKYILGR